MNPTSDDIHELLRLPIRQAAALVQSAYSNEQVLFLAGMLRSAGSEQAPLLVLILATFLARGQDAVLTELLRLVPTTIVVTESAAPDAEDAEYALRLAGQLGEWADGRAASGAASDAEQARLLRTPAHIAFWYGDVPAASRLVRKASAAARRSGDDVTLLLCHADSAECERRTPNLKAALAHYLLAARLFTRANGRPGVEALAEPLARRMFEFATALYYQKSEYGICYQLLRATVALTPTLPQPYFALGNACIRLEKLDEAKQAYAEQARLAPSATAYGNLALVCQHLGETTQAMEAVTQSLRLEPGKVHSLACRAALYASTGELQRAAADWTSILDQIEQCSREGRAEFAGHARMEAAAYAALIEMYEQPGQEQALAALAARLQAQDKPALCAQGHYLAGELARKAGQVLSSRRAYEAALAQFPSLDDAQFRLAMLDADSGDLDEALRRLGSLAPKEQSPQLAMQGLRQLRERFPNEARILRWLGYTAFQLYEFEEAERLLAIYLAQVPGDLEARRWLGQSATCVPIGEVHGEMARDARRLFGGIDMLAGAVLAGDGPARQTLTWIVDRLMCNIDYFWQVLAIDSVAGVYPDLRNKAGLLLAHATGPANTPEQYAARIRNTREYLACAQAYGLECFAIYLHGLVADLHLQRGEMQEAISAARIAQTLLRTACQPCSVELREHARARAQGDGPSTELHQEAEYLHIYALVAPALVEMQVTVAHIFVRNGDHQHISVRTLSAEAALAYADKQSVANMILVADLLRDLDKMDDAQQLLERALLRAETDQERGRVFLAQSILSHRRGLADDAVRQGLAAAPLMPEERRWLCWLSLASFTDDLGRPEEALAYLDRVDIALAARSIEDHFSFHYLRANSLAVLGRHAEAYASAKEAVATLETMRSGFRELSLRGNGAQRASDVCRLAVDLAVKNGDTAAAFGLAEQSRSRQLIDHMAIGSARPGGEQDRVLHQIEQLEARQALIARVQGLAPDHPDLPSLLVQLQVLDSALDIPLWDEAGEGAGLADGLDRSQRTVSAELAHFRARLEQLQTGYAEQLFGEVLGYREAVDLLGELA